MKHFIAATASLALAQASHAADLTWDTTIAVDTTITEGSGTWTTGAGNWNDGATSDAIIWADGDKAFFGGGTEGTAGTVTLGSNITTSSAPAAISINTPFAGDYTFDLATFTLTTGGFKLFGGSTPVIVNSSGGAVELSATNTWSITNGPLTVNAPITGAFGINKFGAGDMFLTNDSNSFTGDLQLVNSGKTTLTSIKDAGVPSAAGAGSLIRITNNADLIYIGTGDSTDRTLQLGNSGSELHSSGTGALIFTGPFDNNSTGPKTFTIQGTNTDANEIQGSLIDSTDAGHALSVSKIDAGSWTLSGDNSYTGTTSISGGGTLTISGNNTTTGDTTLSTTGSVLNINSDTALGSGMLTINNQPTIGNTSGGLVTIPNAVTLNGNTSFVSTNDLVIDGDITLGANRSISVTTDNANALTLNGVISDGGNVYSLGKTGGGNLVLTNPNNSFTGLLALNNGRTVSVSSIGMSGVNSAAGAGSQIDFGFNCALAYTGTGDTSDRTLNIENSGYSNINNNGTGALILTGAFTNAQAGTKELRFGGSNSDANEISSVIIDSTDVGLAALSVTKVNGSTWILSGNNTYSGGTTVDNGTLLINNTAGSGTGTGNVQVNGGTLGGDGSISGAVIIGDTTGSADAILAPGNSIETIDTGDLTFASDGSYSVEVDGTLVTADQTNVTGTVTIDAAATLAVSVTGTLVDGQQYTIIANDDVDAVTGTFAGLAEGATVGTFGAIDLTISYAGGDGNDVVLSAVTGSSSPYDTWAAGPFANAFTNTDPDVDFDNDGLDNLLEFVLGGDPTISETGIAPDVVSAASGSLVITFKRSDASELAPAVTTSVQISDDLSFSTPANDIVIGAVSDAGPIAPSGASYTVVNSGGFDTITVTIPSPGSKNFARVAAEQP